jgi:hypothetical protein
MNQVSLLWSHAVEKTDICKIRTILDLITYNRVKTEYTEQEMSLLQDSERKIYTQNIIKNKYGVCRGNVTNPYEIFDHYSVDYNMNHSAEKSDPTQTNILNSDTSLNIEGARLNFSHLIHDEFKNILL